MRTPPLGCAVLLALVITPAVLVLFAQTPPPAPSPSRKESPPASADYDLRWGVKIPMRDKVELNATLYLPKTADGSLPRMPVIFTLTPSSPNSIFWQKNYCSGGIVADETAKDARIAQIQVHHDAEHASSMRLPLR